MIGEEPESDDPMADSYDHLNNIVSCHTYSAGVDITEMIWPTVMDQVLDWFQTKAEEDDERERYAAKAFHEIGIAL